MLRWRRKRRRRRKDYSIILEFCVFLNRGNCFRKPNKADNNVTSKQPTSAPGTTECPSQSSHPLPPPPLLALTSSVKKRSVTLPVPMSESEILSSPHLKSFSFTVLMNATVNFRPDSLIGEGGFGYVYKGWLNKEILTPSRPGSGMVVAVKKLKPQSFQGHKEWLSEVNYLGQLHHPNLVKLIGYCLEGENRLLVYEYMPRASLENHLFRRSAKPLPWDIRIKVAIGAARGLSFLHGSESQVIYRDFKASNILLDAEFNAKLSDFGLAKAGPTGDLTHVTTQVMGTQGYAAPEYLTTGRLTAKCDVYSFGVVLLELLTGRRAVDKRRVGTEQKLLDWVTPQLRNKRKLCRIMDTKLEGQYPQKGAYVAAHLALQCVHNEARYRPHMADVLAILEKLPSPKFMVIRPSSDQQIIPSPPPEPPFPSPLKWTPGGSPLPTHTESSQQQGSSLPAPRKSSPRGSSMPVYIKSSQGR